MAKRCDEMINKNRLVKISVAVVVVAVLGILILDGIFPKAEKLALPDKAYVVSVTAGSDSMEKTELSPGEYERLFVMMSNVKPTRKQSVNDYPYVRPYYTVSVATAEAEYRYFVYSEDSQVYVEQPYVGVYKSDGQLLDFILSNKK